MVEQPGRQPRRRVRGQAARVSSAALAKVAGILVEGRPQEGWAVLGIGLNVAVRLEDLPAELRPGASRPAATMGLGRTISSLRSRSCWGARAPTREPPERRSRPGGRATPCSDGEIEWAGGSGSRRGIDGDGRLVVEDSRRAGAPRWPPGEVHLQRVG